jgi:hypothetical protein
VELKYKLEQVQLTHSGDIVSIIYQRQLLHHFIGGTIILQFGLENSLMVGKMGRVACYD